MLRVVMGFGWTLKAGEKKGKWFRLKEQSVIVAGV